MSAEERYGEPTNDGNPIREHSFDELARGLANGTLSRGRALRLMGAAIAGAFLTSIPGRVLAQEEEVVRCRGQICRPGEVCVRRRGFKPECGCPTHAPVVCDPEDSVQACCPETLPTCCPVMQPNPAAKGCCGAGEVCCPAGSAQDCCPVSTRCTSTGCEPVFPCPEVSCCCLCVYENNVVTGVFSYACGSQDTNMTRSECEQFCQPAPPGETLRTIEHGCEDSSSTGYYRQCIGGGTSGVVSCETLPCKPPASTGGSSQTAQAVEKGVVGSVGDPKKARTKAKKLRKRRFRSSNGG
jgi:hypothetical protein